MKISKEFAEKNSVEICVRRSDLKAVFTRWRIGFFLLFLFNMETSPGINQEPVLFFY